MARKSSSYDPNKYGKGFELMPEGPQEFTIADAYSGYSKRGSEQWTLELQPLNEGYKKVNDDPYKCWLSVDGCVEALADARGIDPYSIPDKDYTPEMFKGVVIWGEVKHSKPNEKGYQYANIDRPYPKYSLDNAGGVEASTDEDPFPSA